MVTVHLKFGDEVKTTYMSDNGDILDLIEMELYINWNLDPSDGNWKDLFNRFNFAHFDYCGTEYFTVEYRHLKSDGSEIEVLIKEGLA